MLKIAVIIPVKTFARAKSRLVLPNNVKKELCGMMLQELLETLSKSNKITKVIMVTKDDTAKIIAKKFDIITITDDTEQGVNQAVSLADDYIRQNNISATIVLPQDIPFIKITDIDFLLKNQPPPNFVTIVPSRKFDGTNALFRMPHNIIKTHYDQDSYVSHMQTAKKHTKNASVLFVTRIMNDIDDIDDLKYALRQNEKPALCQKIQALLESNNCTV